MSDETEPVPLPPIPPNPEPGPVVLPPIPGPGPGMTTAVGGGEIRAENIEGRGATADDAAANAIAIARRVATRLVASRSGASVSWRFCETTCGISSLRAMEETWLAIAFTSGTAITGD